VNRAGEGHQRQVVRLGQHAVVHRAEALPTDPNEVEALDRLHNLRRERRKEAQPGEDPLAVRLDGLSPKGSRRAGLTFQDKD